MSQPPPTQRFSDRVENYVRYRPGYPDAMREFLERAAGWTRDSVVADLGSGTGISAEYLLRLGNEVYGVEPNEPMRRAAESLLAGYERFHSVAATAEATTLPDASVDLVVAAQAFHWFDLPKVRREVARILRPGGRAALIWNVRRLDATPFLRAYEALLQEHGTDYEKIRHENVGEEQLRAFFGGPYERGSFYNEQTFDYAALEGRLFSSSYVPAPSDPRAKRIRADLRRLFDAHQEDGLVRFEYDTVVYCGQIEMGTGIFSPGKSGFSPESD